MPSNCTRAGTDKGDIGAGTCDAVRYGVRRLSNKTFEKAIKKLGKTVPCSLSGDLTHSVECPIWTVRQRGMGGLVRYPAGGHERLELHDWKWCDPDLEYYVRPLTSKECTLVQGVPHDFYDTLMRKGIHPMEIVKATAQGWPIRTATAVLGSIIDVVDNYLMKDDNMTEVPTGYGNPGTGMQKIVDHRSDGGKIYFRVRWKNCKEDTWLAKTSLLGKTKMVADYERTHKELMSSYSYE